MRVLVIGATGYIGAHVARHLRAAGHAVAGLARTPAAAARLAADGIEPAPGDLTDLASVLPHLDCCDALALCALVDYGHEERTTKILVEALAGQGKTFLFTSGSGVLSLPSPDGHWHEESFAEDDPFVPPEHLAPRVRAEETVRGATIQGLRGIVLRPPLVWGNGGSRQLPALFDSVTKTGAACYIGLGLHCYSHLHVEDLAELYRLALERGEAGAVYHALAGEENWRSLAEAVARVKGCGTRSLTPNEARALWSERAERYFMMCSRIRAPKARAALGWRPTRLDLVADIVAGSYRAAFG